VTHPTAQVTQTRRDFSIVCGVQVNVRANAQSIWRLLTDAEGFPRVFTPRVSGVVPNERMTWTGGFAPIFKGVRTFVLTPRIDGSTNFMMEERFSGLILPLVKGSMPDFGPVFERYANDLKREAERATH
jgi:hypothetical protein